MSDPNLAKANIKDLNVEWTVNGNTLTRAFKARDFPMALGLVNRFARVAVTCNCYPDIILKRDQVIVSLGSPGSNGIQDRDIITAKAIDEEVEPKGP